MIRKIVKIGTGFISVAFGVVLIIFGESWLVGSVYFIGPLITFILFNILSIFICFGVIYLYLHQRKSNNRIIIRIENWIAKQEHNLNRTILKTVQISKIIGIVFSSITVGPLPTTILIGFLKYNIRSTVFLIVISNLVFFMFWIALYSGIITFIK